ncbi:MAG: M24 family metallopeptidase [Acidobacteria bacterium]|nr:M24 family metallopeptidase [Acidobacteriota bacterium]
MQGELAAGLERSAGRHLTPAERARAVPAGVVHFVGLDVHDVGDPFIPLQPGTVVAVEPGVYMARVKEDGQGANVRIEDVYVVGDGVPRRLTDQLPRERVEVERWLAGALARRPERR